LFLSLVVGLFVAKLAYDQINKNKGAVPTEGKLTQVVVIAEPISPGEALTAEKLTMGKVSVDNVPQGSFTSIDQLKGRVAQITLNKSQPVAENFLAPNGTGAGLQFAIPKGMRAISIEVNEFSGVGGMLLPGCHVDLLSTVPAEQGGDMMSRTVVQNVQIIAVGQRMLSQPKNKDDEPQAFRSVTLIATPHEAEAIELAASTGRPRLVLRSGTDKDITQTAGVTSSTLRGQAPKSKVEPKIETVTVPVFSPIEPLVPQYSSVRVIRGTVESEVRFDTGDAYDFKSSFNNRSTAPSTQPTLPTTVTRTDGAVSGSDTAPVHGQDR
jgi:pilus assembly protein CpaB